MFPAQRAGASLWVRLPRCEGPPLGYFWQRRPGTCYPKDQMVIAAVRARAACAVGLFLLPAVGASHPAPDVAKSIVTHPSRGLQERQIDQKTPCGDPLLAWGQASARRSRLGRARGLGRGPRCCGRQ